MQKLDGPSLPSKSGKVKQLVIFLHGYGSNGDDLLSIGEDWAEELPDAVFLSPNAPAVCDAFASGYQWFPIRAISPEAIEREKHAASVAPVLSNYIDEQLARLGLDDSQLAVAGFSQGAMMAMYTMPRRKKACAAVVGFSGMIMDAAGLKGEGIVKVPVLAIHGDRDDLVLPDNLERVDNAFSAAGFDIETVMRPGLGHGIDHFGVTRSLQFVKENFEKAQEVNKRQVKA